MSTEDANDNAIDAVIDAAAGSASKPPAAGLPAVSADVVEQESGEELDNVVPTRGYRLIPTVCLGGSAGSIQALIEFFRAMPPDSGLVFVVVLHLSPEHASTLADLLSQHTAMPVVQAADAMVVEANRVYVIPPGKHLLSVDGHLKLISLEPERGKRVAVDVFFRTLADTHGAHAAGIVLSGADGDGAIGLKRIKERGGLTVAQDPNEAEHDSMPRSAIATSMVDWVLKTQEMPARLLEYFSREGRIRLPEEGEPTRTGATPPGADAQEADLREVLTFLHTRTGRDFSYYKRATVLRRISRRMQINGSESLPEYLSFLRTHPGESGALLQDMLISVTNFFRDREAFAVLETHIPQLFRDKRPSDTVRVWVAACASGEEAYSVAMLLAEHASKLTAPPSLQVFATDLAEDVVQSARAGVYPATITTDVSEDRLARFFIKEHRGYRVRRELREAVLFAQHDLLKDSPFSKLDLVTCRNLLIYLNRDAQRRALEVFHFSLARQRLLFLGTSESADDAGGLFMPVDKKARLYAAQSAVKMNLPVPVGVSTLTRALQVREDASERTVLPAGTNPTALPTGPFFWPRTDRTGDREAVSETYLHILARGGPASIIVTGQQDILHLSGGAGRYLQFGEGELTRDLLQAIHPMLRVELRGALSRAVETGQLVLAPDLLVELDGQRQGVDIQVTPVQEAASYFVVTFTPRAAAPSLAVTPLVVEADPLTQQLERELTRVKGRLRDVQEQHEVTVEEHKSSVEELQAINEELRSASEELETSREELQAINEELTTVNAELKARVDELGHSNSDLHNLMAATNIATVFLDRQLGITRYTPPAVSLFNLIPTDVGRPLTDLKHRLDYPELEEDATSVLATLSPTERVIKKEGEGWFLARLQPYRSLDDHIAGVVLTCVDITERRRAEEALHRNEQRVRWQKEAFQAEVNGAPLGESLSLLVRPFTEGLMGEVRSAFYITNPEGTRLHPISGAGDMPESYLRKIDGFLIGVDSLACGLAIPAGGPMISRDILTEPLWKPWTKLAQEYDFRGCWSFPIQTRDNKGVGTFALYFREPHTATPEDLALADVIAQGAAIILSHYIEGQERVRAEEAERAAFEEAKRARTEAEEASAAKDHFLAVLSHELRTPLMPINMAMATLSRRTDLPEPVRQVHAMIQRNVALETRFIDDMLDVTRIAHGKMEIVREDLDLHEAVRRAVEVSKPDLEAKGQRLTVTLEGETCRFHGDLARLQQVFWNLLKNASKFTPDGGAIEVRSRCTVGEDLVVEVIDSGIGMEAEAAERIFKPFEQANISVTRQFGGLGLGLAIAKATVEAHGGTLRAESSGLGQGATFIVTLPTAPSVAEPIRNAN